MDFSKIQSRGYSFMEEILFWCRQVGCTFGETPITFENRRGGISKINSMEAVEGAPDHRATRCGQGVRPGEDGLIPRQENGVRNRSDESETVPDAVFSTRDVLP